MWAPMGRYPAALSLIHIEQTRYAEGMLVDIRRLNCSRCPCLDAYSIGPSRPWQAQDFCFSDMIKVGNGCRKNHCSELTRCAGVMSGLLTGVAFTKQFPEIDTTDTGNGSSSLQGTVVAIYEIGCFFGSIFCLFAGEWLGRRRCIWLGCIILSIGAALQASAYGIPQMIVGRIVAGLGNGINTSTIRTCTIERLLLALLTTSSCLAF